MQTVSQPCGICKQRISLQCEGTWCARCKTVFHHSCLEDAKNRCSTCGYDRERPEKYFIYSKICPTCFAPNEPPRATCPHCNDETRWDTEEKYHEYKQMVHLEARRERLKGILCLSAALLLIISFILYVWFYALGDKFYVIMSWFSGPLILIPAGIVKLAYAKKLRRFE